MNAARRKARFYEVDSVSESPVLQSAIMTVDRVSHLHPDRKS